MLHPRRFPPTPNQHRPQAATCPRKAHAAAFTAVLITLLCSPWLAAAPAAPQPGQELLSADRWSEQSIGLSLRPPLGARLETTTGDEAVLRITGENRYQITVSIKRIQQNVAFLTLQQSVLKDVLNAQPSAEVKRQKEIQLELGEAAALYFVIPPQGKQKQPWALGQALVQVDSRTIVLLRLDTLAQQLDEVAPILEAMLHSLRIEDPKALAEKRKQQSEAGNRWHKAVTMDQRRSALIPEQWFRVLQDGKDVGWMRVDQYAITAQDLKGGNDKRKLTSPVTQPGIAVRIQARVLVGANAVDSLSEFYLSDDQASEIWSIRTTMRSKNEGTSAAAAPGKDAKGKQLAPQAITATETGVRTGDEINIRRETPEDSSNQRYQLPRENEGYYVPQLDLHLLGQIIPRQAGEVGFYAYFPGAAKMSFRTETFSVDGEGNLMIRSRPTPSQGEQISKYDRAGRLLERTLPGGQQLIPTTPQKLGQLWKVTFAK